MLSSHLRQAWAAHASGGAPGRFVHVFLPDDPDEAHRVLATLSSRFPGHMAAADDGPTAYDHGRLHDLVANGGFSSHPWRGDAPQHGFMASYEAPEGSGVAVVHDLAHLKPDHIAEHRNTISHHLQNPSSYQGGWLDRSEDKVYLDASKHFEHEPDVRQFATQQKQKAYFNLGTFDEHYLHPKLDPLAMKDEHAWKQRYSTVGTEPPPEYHSYAHLYPATDEQKHFWGERGHHLAVKAKPPNMAGRPVGPWLNPPRR